MRQCIPLPMAVMRPSVTSTVWSRSTVSLVIGTTLNRTKAVTDCAATGLLVAIQPTIAQTSCRLMVSETGLRDRSFQRPH
jgi:hypothetical protein